MFLRKNSGVRRRFLELVFMGLFFTGLGILIASGFNWSPTIHAHAPHANTSPEDVQQTDVSPVSTQPYLLSGQESPFVAVAEKINQVHPAF